jgi:hypothetical protein
MMMPKPVLHLPCRVLASYAGHLRHGSSWRVWARVWGRYPWLPALIDRQAWAVDERWSRRRVTRARRFQSQYWRPAQLAGQDSLIFFRVGRFIEFYGPQRLAATNALRLNTAVLPRGSYGFTADFPVRLLRPYASRALQQGLIVVEVEQSPELLPRGFMLRLPCTVLIAAAMGNARHQGYWLAF